MGTIIVSIPDFSDSELLFNDEETRQILRFFYPAFHIDIDALAIDNDARRFAQTLFIAAVDGTLGLGMVDDLLQTLTSGMRQTNKTIQSLGKKLAARFVFRWYQHATLKDMDDVRIYDAVRKSIANANQTRLKLLISGQYASIRGARWTQHLTMVGSDRSSWG